MLRLWVEYSTYKDSEDPGHLLWRYLLLELSWLPRELGLENKQSVFSKLEHLEWITYDSSFFFIQEFLESFTMYNIYSMNSTYVDSILDDHNQAALSLWSSSA